MPFAARTSAASLVALVLILCASAPSEASAQETVDGNWILVLNSPIGTNQIPVTIAQDGERLTATLSVDAPAGQEFNLDGSLTGSNVRFRTEVEYEGMPLEINLEGTVSGGSMSGIADYGGMAQGDWTAQRAQE